MAGPYNYYIGPWVWVEPVFDSDTLEQIGGGYWRAPLGTVGLIDLRGLPDQSLFGMLGDKPYGFFAVFGTLPSEYSLLGSGDLREITSTAAMKSAWNSLHGYSPEGDTLNDLLFDHITSGSDPTYQGPTPPLMPTASGILEVSLGGHSLIKSERFRYGTHPHTNKVQAVLHRNYRNMRAEVEAGRMIDGHERRVLDFWLDKYRLDKIDPASWKRLVSPELRAGHSGPLPHRTTITESFNKADSDILGPDLTWTELIGDLDVVSNEAQTTDANSFVVRADSNLSGDDHYAQASMTNSCSGSGTSSCQAVARKDSSATETFYVAIANWEQNTLQLFKAISGTFTQLGSNVSQTLTDGVYETIRTECDGSTIKHVFNSVDKITETDTAITGNLRTGLRGKNNKAGCHAAFDDFEAADLAAGQTVITGLAIETDTAFAITSTKTLTVGLATETETSFSVTIDRTLTVELITETDTAFGVTVVRALNVGLSIETDTAFVVTVGAATVVGLTTEANTAFATTIDRALNVGLATETQTSFVVSAAKVKAVGLTLEIDSAFDVSFIGPQVSSAIYYYQILLPGT